MIKISEALKTLQPEGAWVINHTSDGDSIDWLSADITQPTDTEIQAEVTRLQVEFDSKQYQRDRQYPSLEDQADMQYWDAINGTTTWLDAIQAVKDAHPKGDN
jgi:hypothetical protein